MSMTDMNKILKTLELFEENINPYKDDDEEEKNRKINELKIKMYNI